jgi:hypothetical protein
MEDMVMSISGVSSNNSIYPSGSQQILSQIQKNMKGHHHKDIEASPSGSSAAESGGDSDSGNSGLSGTSGSIVDIMA